MAGTGHLSVSGTPNSWYELIRIQHDTCLNDQDLYSEDKIRISNCFDTQADAEAALFYRPFLRADRPCIRVCRHAVVPGSGGQII